MYLLIVLVLSSSSVTVWSSVQLDIRYGCPLFSDFDFLEHMHEGITSSIIREKSERAYCACKYTVRTYSHSHLFEYGRAQEASFSSTVRYRLDRTNTCCL